MFQGETTNSTQNLVIRTLFIPKNRKYFQGKIKNKQISTQNKLKNQKNNKNKFIFRLRLKFETSEYCVFKFVISVPEFLYVETLW